MFTDTAIRTQGRAQVERSLGILWITAVARRFAPMALMAACLAGPAMAQSDTTDLALDYEQEQNILFVANCVGALWPEGMPIAAAGGTLPDGAMRYLDAHFFLDAQRQTYPRLASEIDAQIAAMPAWLEDTAESDPVTAAEFRQECAIFLDEWLPARAFGA